MRTRTVVAALAVGWVVNFGAPAAQADEPPVPESRAVRYLVQAYMERGSGGHGPLMREEVDVIVARDVSDDLMVALRAYRQAGNHERGVCGVLRVLGIIKDPAIADELAAWLAAAEWNPEYTASFVSGWHYQLAYFAAQRDEWRAMEDVWFDFLTSIPDKAFTPISRRMLIGTMSQWFYGERADAWFKAQAETDAFGLHARFLAALIALQRGVPVARAAFDELANRLSEREPVVFCAYAGSYPHAYLVPHVAKLLDDEDRDSCGEYTWRHLTLGAFESEAELLALADEVIPDGARLEWAHACARHLETLVASRKGLQRAVWKTCSAGDPLVTRVIVPALVEHPNADEAVAGLLQPTLDDAAHGVVRAAVERIEAGEDVSAKTLERLETAGVRNVTWKSALGYRTHVWF
jgi:hypothetical protein